MGSVLSQLEANARTARGTLTASAAEEIKGLRSLALDMGRLIRRMDETGEHSEFWTQDGNYIIDGRFPK